MLTPKQQGEDSALKGHLEDQAGERESLRDYQQKSLEQLNNLQQLIRNGRERIAKDPVVIEYANSQEGQDDG